MDEEKKDGVTQDYIKAINELKANTVEKSEYEKVRADNKRLLDSIVNGATADEEPKAPVLREPQEIRKELFTTDASLSNLDFAQKALELRTSLIARGETDPFLPSGKQILATNEDIEAANRVASVLSECIEYAQGDNSVFTNELQRRTIDVRIR